MPQYRADRDGLLHWAVQCSQVPGSPAVLWALTGLRWVKGNPRAVHGEQGSMIWDQPLSDDLAAVQALHQVSQMLRAR